MATIFNADDRISVALAQSEQKAPLNEGPVKIDLARAP